MQCPACQVDLVMSERQSIEIDYCPKCRGVWLDRGELDKIIEQIRGIGFEVTGMTPEEATAFVNGELRTWGPVIKAAGIKAE